MALLSRQKIGKLEKLMNKDDPKLEAGKSIDQLERKEVSRR